MFEMIPTVSFKFAASRMKRYKWLLLILSLVFFSPPFFVSNGAENTLFFHNDSVINFYSLLYSNPKEIKNKEKLWESGQLKN